MLLIVVIIKLIMISFIAATLMMITVESHC